METVYALLIFVAVVFIVYQIDRLIRVGFENRRKKDNEGEDIVERQDVISDEPNGLSDPDIASAEPLDSTTKDEMIDDLSEQNARLLAEVDALREQIATLVAGEQLHRVE